MALLLALALVLLQEPSPTSAPPPVVWDARTAEHLLTRAGFGASRARIERAAREGMEATVDALFAAGTTRDPFLIERFEPTPQELAGLSVEARRDRVFAARRESAQQLRDYRVDWFERVLADEDPLRERMLLFWHGFFTTSATVVEEQDKVLRQVELLRAGALGSYADLLHAIVRDPAMLEYLDNDENRRKWANENLARELMELFSLGEGNYTEEDVKQAARALTGRRAGPDGAYELAMSEHDTAEKTILGETGRFGGDELVDLLLAQDACPRWVAGRVIAHLEGRPPSEERLADYAAFLREVDFELTPFLRKLFTDPAFYRDEVVGSRVQSPLDLLVGTCLRVGLDPPAIFLVVGTSVLGQQLMEPPNVKGWEEGEAWISTSSFVLRSNLLALLLAVHGPDDPEASAEVEEAFRRELRTLREFGESRYRPRIHLASRLARRGIADDRRVVDFLVEELLASEVEQPARDLLVEFLERERAAAGIAEGALPDAGRAGERILRRLAHLILSLPEAQLA